MAVTLLTQTEKHLPKRYASELGIELRRVRLREGQLIDA
jgi:hypothetical protein